MLMNTMEALGAGSNLSLKGETPGLNLGADAETLALFASLFAMMQNPQPDVAETAASSLVTQSQPDVTDSTPLLPAAAMLMASLAPRWRWPIPTWRSAKMCRAMLPAC